MSKNANVRKRVPVIEKILFGFADAGRAALDILMASYVTIYLTDTIGISGVIVSAILVAARIFDAINDPVIGSLADRTKTKYGRYRPWVFFGSIAAAIAVTLMFSNNPNWSATIKAVYAVVMYFVLTITTTSFNVPIIALNSVMSEDNDERTSVTIFRSVFSNLGTVTVPMVLMPMVMKFSGDGSLSAGGYSKAVMVVGICAAILGMIGAVVSKERMTLPPKQTGGIPIKEQLKAMSKNSAVIILVLCWIMFGFICFGRQGVMLYYFTYYVGDINLYSLTGIFGMIGSFLGPMIVASLLMKFIPHKGRAAAISVSVVAVCYFINGFLNPGTGFAWWVFACIGSIFECSFCAIVSACIPECCDYGELVSGFRVDGFLSSATSFGLKFGSAIGPALCLSIMTGAGYVANQQQPENVLKLINSFITFIPGVLLVLTGVVCLLFYKISPQKRAEMTEELQRRRAEAPQA